jgi:hypothetical protein
VDQSAGRRGEGYGGRRREEREGREEVWDRGRKRCMELSSLSSE